MTHQSYKRRCRSLKDSDIPGIFYGSPTWDDASAHWNGFVESESRCVNGEGYSISPTRTPWASWWRPWTSFKEDAWWCMPMAFGEAGETWISWAMGVKIMIELFHFRDGVYSDWTLPDVCKENPQ